MSALSEGHLIVFEVWFKKYDADYDFVLKFVTIKSIIEKTLQYAMITYCFCGRGTLNALKKLAEVSFFEVNK